MKPVYGGNRNRAITRLRGGRRPEVKPNRRAAAAAAAAETHPEEQVEEEEQVLDAVVDRHRGSVSVRDQEQSQELKLHQPVLPASALTASDWPTCSLGAEPSWGREFPACPECERSFLWNLPSCW